MITFYVNTASTAGGDGTTNNTAGATRAFASLHEALDAQPAELLDATTIICEGSAADTLPTVQTEWDFETTADHYLLVTVAEGNRHNGKWDNAKYRLEVAGESAIYNNIPGHVRLEWIQAQVTWTGADTARNVFRLTSANNLNQPVAHSYYNCIGKIITAVSNSVSGFSDSDPITDNGTCIRKNCIVDISDSGEAYNGFMSDSSAWAALYLKNYNCTCVGSYFPFLDAQICVNCLAADSFTGAGYAFYNTTTTGSSNNVSDDGSAVGTNSHTNHTITFVDSANGDFHLHVNDVGARGFGIGPGSNAAVPTTDIDLDARSGTTCDVGADEYTAGAATNVVLNII